MHSKWIRNLVVVAALSLPFAAFAKPNWCPNIRAAQRHLIQAQASLVKGAPVYQGHRVKAMEAVKAALAEVEQALAVRQCK